MMHVKCWIVACLLSLAAGGLAPQNALAAPTGGHVGAPSTDMRMNRDVRQVEPTRAGPPQANERRNPVEDRAAGERQIPVVERASPLVVNPLAVNDGPSVFATRFYPQFLFGQGPLGEFSQSACANYLDGSSRFGVFAPNPLVPTDCLRPAYLNGQGREYDPRSSLVPGENKDALYGPAYRPNDNLMQ